MKIKVLTSACLLALGASHAYALDPATSAAATTVKIYGSGASAQINTITGLFGTLCDGTPSLYTFSGNLRGVSCKVKAGVSQLAGKNVFLSYNADGGSGNGVYPLAKLVDSGGAFTASLPSQRPQIVDPSVCTGTAPNYTCTTSAVGNRWSDFGVSDVEPAMFAFPLNTPADFASTTLEEFELANLDVGSQFQVVFGIAVTNKLYDDLAAAQGVAVPSISRTALSSLLGGVLTDPASGLGWQVLFTPGTLPAGSAVTGAVNIGRRVNGSGTQTAANAYFLDYVARARAAGVTIPIIPGLKILTTRDHLTVLPKVFHTNLPDELVDRVMSAKDDREVRRVGIEWAHRQSVGLMEAGYMHLHYYIMQNTTPFVELMHLLRVQA